MTSSFGWKAVFDVRRSGKTFCFAIWIAFFIWGASVCPLYADETEISVDTRSGRLSVAAKDLELDAGVMKIGLIRRLAPPGQGGLGLFGIIWRTDWDNRLSASENRITIESTAGPLVFSRRGDSKEYLGPPGERLTLNEDGTAVRRRTDLVEESYNEKGRLASYEDKNGNAVSFLYDDNGKLVRIEGPKGTFLKIDSDARGRIAGIETSSGSNIEYIYSEKGPEQVKKNENPVVGYSYDDNGNLTRIENPKTGSVDFEYDDRGRVIRQTWADGSQETYQYDDETRTYTHTDPVGAVTVTRWSEDGQRREITDPLGNTSVIETADSGRIVTVTGPTGLTSKIVHDELMRPVVIESCCGEGETHFEYLEDTRLPKKTVYPDGTEQTFHYDANGNLLEIREAGKTVVSCTYFRDGSLASIKGEGEPKRRYSYNSQGRIQSETNALGETIRYKYDRRGNLIRSVDPSGRERRYDYDDLDRLTGITDSEGRLTRYEYDEIGRIVSKTDASGGVSRFEYDVRGRLAAETDPAGRTIRYRRDPAGKMLSVTRPGESTRKYEYDPVGRIVRETNPLGGVTVNRYDALGRLLGAIDPMGGETRYMYDPSGGMKRLIDPLGNVTEYEYDAQGRKTAEIDPTGLKTRYEYDSKGRTSKIAFSDGLVRSFTYAPDGKLMIESDNLGKDVRYAYDALGRVEKETHGSGLEFNYQYDENGNLIRIRDSLGGSSTMRYNSTGDVTAITGPFGAVTKFEYDPMGRMTERIDSLGYASMQTYGPGGDPATFKEPAGDESKYEYADSGRIATARHPSGGATGYSWDAEGNLLGTTDPLGNRDNRIYDESGRLVRFTDAEGRTTSYQYDEANRPVRKIYSDGTEIRYRYDAAGNLLEADDGRFPVRFTYDAEGRLAGIDYPEIRRHLKYAYDPMGRIAKFTDSENRVIEYEYDTHGRLGAVRYPGGKAVSFEYDALGRMTKAVYPNGIAASRQYDAKGRVTQIRCTDRAGKEILGWRYRYDDDDRVIGITDQEGRESRYRYDASGQLTAEERPIGTIRYEYGPGGNRVRMEGPDGVVEYEYNEADQVVRAGETTFIYDANGNLEKRSGPEGDTYYRYDADDRLVRVELPDGEKVEFGYAPTGERIWRRDGNGLTHYVTDGWNILAELDENLNAKSSYVHGQGLDYPLMMHRDGKDYFYHANLIGTVKALTNAEGNAAVEYDTDAFGVPAGVPDGPENPFLFTARVFDPALKLYDFRTRFYDPELGRFISRDKVKAAKSSPRSLNPYLYVLNNPLKYTDPIGAAPNPVTQLQSPYTPTTSVNPPDSWTRPTLQATPTAPGDLSGSTIDAVVGHPPGSVYGTWDPVNGPRVYPAGQANSTRLAGTVHHEGYHGEFWEMARDPNNPRGGTADVNLWNRLNNNPAFVNRNEQNAAWQEAHHLVRDRGASLNNPEVRRAIDYYKAHGGDESKLTEALNRWGTGGSGRGGSTGAGVGPGSGRRGGPAASVGGAPGGSTPPATGRVTEILQRHGGKITIALTAAQLASCVAQGKSVVECAKELAIGMAVGGAIVTVVGPTGAVILGAAAGVISIYQAGVEATEQWQDWRQRQEAEEIRQAHLRQAMARFDDLAGKVRANIATAEGLWANAQGICREAQTLVGKAQQNEGKAGDLLAQVKGTLAPIDDAVNGAQNAAEIKAGIDALQTKTAGYEETVVQGIEWATAKAAACKTKEDASKILNMYNNCKGLTRGMSQYAAQAKADNARLQAAKAKLDAARGLPDAADGLREQLGAVVSTSRTFYPEFDAKRQNVKALMDSFASIERRPENLRRSLTL